MKYIPFQKFKLTDCHILQIRRRYPDRECAPSIPDCLIEIFNITPTFNGGIEYKEYLEFEKRLKNIVYPKNTGDISDGYHTFNELYYHRMILFSIICNQNKDKAWKSWLHSDGTMFEDYFIVGISTPKGDYTYHYHKDYWDMFKVHEFKTAPVWDGHKPEDVDRLLSLLD